MYDRAGEPKKLWVIPGAAHYDVCREEHLNKILDMSVAWISVHLLAY